MSQSSTALVIKSKMVSVKLGDVVSNDKVFVSVENLVLCQSRGGG